MYEDYLQSYYNYPLNEFQNTYEAMEDTYPYGYYQNRNTYDYNFGFQPLNYQTRRITNSELEEMYPDVYKIIYPMVKKVCRKNTTRAITQDVIENMVEEVYSNVEEGGQIELNREVKKEETKNENKEIENRGRRRNSNLLDVIKILLLRELIGRPGYNRPEFRPNMPPPPRPPFYTRPPFSA